MNWHRLFGLVLCDFFAGSPFTVELEKDLSIKKQLLDVVILRRGVGEVSGRLPDGLEDLATHNLITFKSHQEALDDWALKELTGHYVNYRKQAGVGDVPLLPEAEFRLYAVCSRFPHNLASLVTLERLQEGVYDCRRGTDVIRIVIAGELPEAEHNAPLHLFSALRRRLDYGANHSRSRSEQTSTLLYQLFEGYNREGLIVSYTLEDFKRDFIKEHMKDLSPQELREGLQKLSAEQLREVLQGLSAPESPEPKKPSGKGRGKPKR